MERNNLGHLAVGMGSWECTQACVLSHKTARIVLKKKKKQQVNKVDGIIHLWKYSSINMLIFCLVVNTFHCQIKNMDKNICTV